MQNTKNVLISLNYVLIYPPGDDAPSTMAIKIYIIFNLQRFFRPFHILQSVNWRGAGGGAYIG